MPAWLVKGQCSCVAHPAPHAGPGSTPVALMVWTGQVRKTRYQMHKAIDPDYYGFRDEEDGVLEPLEAEAEKNMRTQVGSRGPGAGMYVCSTAVPEHDIKQPGQGQTLNYCCSYGPAAVAGLRAEFTCILCIPSLQAVLDWEEKEHERQAALTGAGVAGDEQDDDDGVAGAKFVAYVPLPGGCWPAGSIGCCDGRSLCRGISSSASVWAARRVSGLYA